MSYQSAGDGNYSRPIPLYLEGGSHRLRLTKGGGSVRPGDAAPSRLLAISITAAGADELTSLPAGDWRSLCERELDWLEAVRAKS